MDQVTLFSLITSVGTICAIVFGYIGYAKGVKKESHHEGEIDGTQKADIEYIKRRTDDILLEQRETNKSVNALAERVTRVEESVKSAHKRLDQIEEKDECKKRP